MQNNEAAQLFKDMGFGESTSRAMAEEYSDAHSQMKGRGGEVRLSDREIRIRADAQRLKNSGRCDNDNTARAAAEAKEAMRNLFR